MKISRKLETTTGDFKTILHKKLAKCKLDDVTPHPVEWINDFKLLRRDLRNLDVHIGNSEMTNRIILNLLEEY